MTSRFQRTLAVLSIIFAASLSYCAAVSSEPVSLDPIKSDVELSTKDIGAKEAAIGDVVADAMKASAKTDGAFIAATSFSDSVEIAKGMVDTAEIVNALVYKSESIVIVKLSGDQITKATEQSLFLYPKSNSAFLQFSGFVVTIKPDADAGNRVASIKVDGDTLDPKKTYRVAMPAPLANGGLAYFKVWQKTSIEKDTDISIESALNSYFAAHKMITKGEDRLVTRK